MFQSIKVFGVVFLLFLSGAIDSASADLVFGPVEIDGTANDWLTSSTIKPNDIDGDNIYGTFGAIHFGRTTTGAMGFVNSGTQFRLGGYSPINDLSGGVDTEAGIALSQYTFAVNSSVASTDTLRIGAMHDVLTSGEHAADFGWSVQLLGVTGANAGQSITSSVLPGGNGIVDMVFFDVTNGVAAGDQFQLVGVSNAGRAQNAYISSVSLDFATVAVPEPTSAMLFGVVGLLLLSRRKR